MGQRRKNLPDKNAYLLDCHFNDMLKKGRPLVNPSTGEPLLDDNGQQLYGPLTAADLNAIRGRLKDCGMRETEATDPIAEAMEQVRLGTAAPDSLASLDARLKQLEADTFRFPGAADG